MSGKKPTNMLKAKVKGQKAKVGRTPNPDKSGHRLTNDEVFQRYPPPHQSVYPLRGTIFNSNLIFLQYLIRYTEFAVGDEVL
jgi:hypothetical protein